MNVAVYSHAESVDQGGGVVYTMSIASALAEIHNVDLYFPTSVDPQELFRLLPQHNILPRICEYPIRLNLRIIGELRRALYDLNYDRIVVQSPHIPRMTLCRNAYLLCEFPFTRTPALDDRIRLKTYKRVITNSSYTARWIQRRWGCDATVLHPPVIPIPAQPKRPYILAVGRFLAGGRSKRQLEIVSVFRQLLASGLKDWELHLAGFGQDRQYVEQVMEAAQGLPIYFHFNISRSDLELLYGVSSLFWHAVGFDVDTEIYPERMEHFGIVTVEAMSAGCVPVVINRGGQTEIVGEDGAGVLWETLQDCAEATWNLIHDREKLESMSQRAMVRAGDFSFPIFAQKVQDLFQRA